ncbi:MAG TPA: TetR family transcriptional regulator [Frankiaceae bacterium]|nr:TetR family transcriptional regulator [Frankiaceae bacterium]
MNGPRRSPSPDERTRDAERSRAALLDAAEAEFGEKGLAGARVESIAARAGLNKQLISYYFGGKQALYDAIIERWYTRERDFDGPEVSLPDLVLRYFEANRESLHLQRMFLRERLEQDPDAVAFEPDCEDLVRLRRRRQDGEIAEDLDPAFVLLFLQAMVVAPALFPGEVKRLTGLHPSSDEFFIRARDQLGRIVERLGDRRGSGEECSD